MHEILMEQLVAERRRSLQATAAMVKIERGQRRRGTRRSSLALWRNAFRRAPARAPEPARIDLAALGPSELRRLTVVAERVSLAAVDTDSETPGAAA